MKTVVRHLFTAVFLALVGITIFAGAVIQRQVAEGQRGQPDGLQLAVAPHSSVLLRNH